VSVQAVVTPLTREMFDPVFDVLAAEVASGRTAMAALAIGDARGPLRKQVFTAPGEPLLPADGLFFLASVTKPIFATAVMQLVEEGALSLDRPIADWLPEFTGGGKDDVTLTHLLTHTSGVVDVLPEVLRRSRPSAARMTQLTIAAPLRFAPGTRWEYCSSAFYVLAEICRRLTGLPGPEFLRQRLLAPLGMNDTTFDPRRSSQPLMPVRGVGADNRLRRFLLIRYMASIAHPGGGLFATLDDLLRFGAALLSPRRDGARWLPVSASTFELMGEDHVRGVSGEYNDEVRPVHHGLGWSKPTVMKDVPGSARTVDHGGATGTRLWIDPDAGLVFVFFSNRWDADRGPEMAALNATYRALG
jgi:serine-type D-Ala-D-Ala carboxypeptidase